MDIPDDEDVTELLRLIGSGDESASGRLFDLVYSKMEGIARIKRRNWSGNYTLDTNSLVHEAFIKLSSAKNSTWTDRQHFFRTAARAMRQIQINYAEQHCALKRGGGVENLVLDEALVGEATNPETLVVINQLLEQLEKKDERAARVFEYRRFAGYTIKETALLLDISEATVKRDYDSSIAWLRLALSDRTLS